MLVSSIRLASLLAIPSLSVSAAKADDFEDYKSDMNRGLFQIEDEFSQYKKKYQAAYQSYQDEITQFWQSAELSNQKTWVDYSPAMDVKRVVDFDKNEIRISIQGDKLQGFSPKDAEREILAALTMDVDKAYQQDPVLSKVVGVKLPGSQSPLLGLDANMASDLGRKAQLKRMSGKRGELLTITAKLPENSLAVRAYGYVSEVQKASSRWNVPADVIMAIMHTESSFNPMARSHIPAFGLMQIVPKSAGRDASRLVFGQERLLTGADLFKPSTNIQMGAAYLHILDTRYLKGIVDPEARQVCVIAAYNTGAGNVARAFTGNTSVKKALPLINRLTAKQVYAHLRSNLKYQEARNYVKKVTEVMPLYSYT
jgi:membrane-bound lytic murein transglycosylase C